jgi:hypothetical protein
MSTLSPAAQAVLDAAFPVYDAEEHLYVVTCKQHAGMIAATALRAAADQVVPVPKLPYDSCCDVYASAIRAEILAIADELEGFF